VHPDHLDHAPHLRLRAAHVDQAPGAAQPPRHDREIEYERAVREGEVLEVDDEVALGAKSAGESRAAPPPRRDVLISRADQERRLFGELDDG
jgi:hypothetical protein